MQSRRKVGPSSSDSVEGRNGTSLVDDTIYVPVELFGILAECEKQKNPGEALLIKAKDLSWSILAMIASCFADVTPLACLTVWLEITAARYLKNLVRTIAFPAFGSPWISKNSYKCKCYEFLVFPAELTNSTNANAIEFLVSPVDVFSISTLFDFCISI